jgi:hypothetical protein
MPKYDQTGTSTISTDVSDVEFIEVVRRASCTVLVSECHGTVHIILLFSPISASGKPKVPVKIEVLAIHVGVLGWNVPKAIEHLPQNNAFRIPAWMLGTVDRVFFRNPMACSVNNMHLRRRSMLAD